MWANDTGSQVVKLSGHDFPGTIVTGVIVVVMNPVVFLLDATPCRATKVIHQCKEMRAFLRIFIFPDELFRP